ncbi:class I SAM-dependent DNA methyltransferase [Saprospira sp. CCB-QB6]|nr:class I SAM-dependent DNA methyltransferase [Saprospira sp. CCB-QB6]WCL81311.1 class I SAM-dependent DNA methyltransferase [Saprospira sp. CCB-QB6]
MKKDRQDQFKYIIFAAIVNQRKKKMNTAVHNKLVSFIWSIADDCLRDIYVRGKYRDVILPMVVLRRLDALLEDSKEAVLEEARFQKEEMALVDWDEHALQEASGYVFYNTSKWTLQLLHERASNSPQLLLANFEEYLLGFSQNVQEIIEKFNLKAQIRHMVNKDVLSEVVEKFVSPTINLTNQDKLDPEGNKLPALTNLGMGYVFEELIRKFNEENNEEAGEHFTPREVIDLMSRLVFLPIKEALPKVMTIYDPACGSGGMLTEAQNFVKDEEGEIRCTDHDVYLFGKEINDETYAICKSDMMIKGNNPENIRSGSTLSTDEFAGLQFDFMLSNPPYGKSWSSEKKYIDGADGTDVRFMVPLKDYWGKEEIVAATPRSSDGQLLFLMEMLSKMKTESPTGSRIASVHNGSSLFTGDAGSGESNIRRYLIEQDYLEAIIQLPNNLFYNTGITTYIWLLSNRKSAERAGKVQLIDASQLYQKLRKNLGDKNCELSQAHIGEILSVYQELATVERQGEEGIAAQVFENQDFGYYKVNIERPQRLRAEFSAEAIESLLYQRGLEVPMRWAYAEFGADVYQQLGQHKKALLAYCEAEGISLSAKQKTALTTAKAWQKGQALYSAAQQLMQAMGEQVYFDFNQFVAAVNGQIKALGLKLSATEKKAIYSAVSTYDAKAEKVIKRRLKLSGQKLANLLAHLGCTLEQLPDFGYYPSGKAGEYLEYESESSLRDSENIPLKEEIHSYFLEEVRPHIAEAWINLDSVKLGYEISFNKYFYRHQPLRSLEEVSQEIRTLEAESDGLIAEILKLV